MLNYFYYVCDNYVAIRSFCFVLILLYWQLIRSIRHLVNDMTIDNDIGICTRVTSNLILISS